MLSSGSGTSALSDREAALVAGARPGDDFQPLEWNFPPVVAETKTLWRPVESVERCIDLVQLACRTCSVRLVELLVHGVGANVGRVKRHQRQIACLFLLGCALAIGQDPIQ